jgi:hypothetical protein
MILRWREKLVLTRPVTIKAIKSDSVTLKHSTTVADDVSDYWIVDSG